MAFPSLPHTLSVSKGQRAMMWMLQNIDSLKWKLMGISVHLTLRNAHVSIHSCVHLVTFSMECDSFVGKLVILLTMWRMVWAWLRFWVLWFFSSYLPELPSSCPSLWKIAQASFQLTCQWGRRLPSACAHAPLLSRGSGCLVTLLLCVSGILSVLGCILSAAFPAPGGWGKACFLYKV